MTTKDISKIHNYCLHVKKFFNDQFEDTVDYLHSLISEIPQSVSGPSIKKTPKVLKKKDYHHIETNPENDIINIDNTVSDSTAIHDKTENKDIKTGDVVETIIDQTEREASRKAAINIKKQQSMSFVAKLRRPLTLDNDSNVNRKRGSRSKKKKKESVRSSSDEKNTQGPTKHSKTEKSVLSETISRRIAGTSQILSQDHLSIKENAIQLEKIEPLKSSMTTRNSNIKRNFSQCKCTEDKNSNIIDDTVITPTENDIEELSMCEDALEKFIPLVNSTMAINFTYKQKMINATVMLEPLSPIKLYETVVINKSLASSVGKNNEPKFTSRSSITWQEKMQQLKEATTNKEFDDDDTHRR